MKITIGEIQNMNIEELRTLNRLVVAEIKNKRSANSNLVKETLKVGQLVRVNHKKTQGEVFILTEIKRKRATVKNENGGRGFVVPFDLIEVIK